MHSGTAPDVICLRSTAAVRDIWVSMGCRVELLLLSNSHCSRRVFLSSTVTGKRNCHCW